MTTNSYILNLHAHTNYSDGSLSIETMAYAFKVAGFCCFVATDHYYGENDSYSMKREDYKRALTDAKRASRVLDFPVIIGCEMSCGRAEEINVFGHEAIHFLMNNKLTVDNFRKARDQFNCAMQLNHPALGERTMNQKMWEIVDAIERCNSGQDFFDTREMPKEFAHLPQYSNSDAHGYRMIEAGYNIVDQEIKSEDELITFIKTSKPVKIIAKGEEVK